MAQQAVNFFAPGTEGAIDFAQIQRQRDLASMLANTAFKPQEGQMVSGHYVAPGAGSYIAQLAAALGAGMANRKADAQEKDLIQTLQAKRSQEANDFLGALNGSEAKTIPNLTPNDDEGNPMPVAQKAAVAPDRSRALAIALQSQNPTLQAMGGELMKRDMDAAELRDIFKNIQGGGPAPTAGGVGGAPASGGVGPIPGGVLPMGVNPAAAALSLNPRTKGLASMIQDASKPLNVTEGGSVWDPATGTVRFTAPKTEAGIGISNGMAAPVPGFQEAQARREGMIAQARQSAEAANRIVQIPGENGRTYTMTGQQAVNAANGQGGGAPAGYGSESQMRATAQGDMGAAPGAIDREIQKLRSDLSKVPDASSKALIQDEIDRLSVQKQKYGGGLALPGIAGPTPETLNAQEADKTRQVNTAKSDVDRDNARQADVKTANKFLNITSRVKDVFADGPTDSGVGSIVDSGMALVGKSTKGAEAAQRLKALGGWLVANVPRMEGPQSNFDVANYQVMAADVANDKLPLARRRAALDSIEGMMKDIAAGKQGAPASGAQSSKLDHSATLRDAQSAIARGADPAKVRERLKQMGIEVPQGATGGW